MLTFLHHESRHYYVFYYELQAAVQGVENALDLGELDPRARLDELGLVRARATCHDLGGDGFEVPAVALKGLSPMLWIARLPGEGLAESRPSSRTAARATA